MAVNTPGMGLTAASHERLDAPGSETAGSSWQLYELLETAAAPRKRET
jgi:hypothetical protein